MGLSDDVRAAILEAAYVAYSPTIAPVPLRELQEREGWEYGPFERVVDEMTGDGLIEPVSSGMRYKITGRGILDAENEGGTSNG